VPPEDRGLGRGWASVTRVAENVTARVIEEARGSVERFKAELLTHGRLTLHEVVALAGKRHPHARVSDRVALAERAVWELLHEGRLVLEGHAERDQWGPVLLSWDAWREGGAAVEPPSG
jgi:hypothetical protein